jgi:hypothetical protein
MDRRREQGPAREYTGTSHPIVGPDGRQIADPGINSHWTGNSVRPDVSAGYAGFRHPEPRPVIIRNDPNYTLAVIKEATPTTNYGNPALPLTLSADADSNAREWLLIRLNETMGVGTRWYYILAVTLSIEALRGASAPEFVQGFVSYRRMFSLDWDPSTVTWATKPTPTLNESASTTRLLNCTSGHVSPYFDIETPDNFDTGAGVVDRPGQFLLTAWTNSQTFPTSVATAPLYGWALTVDFQGPVPQNVYHNAVISDIKLCVNEHDAAFVPPPLTIPT